jgi:hypothetical protein
VLRHDPGMLWGIFLTIALVVAFACVFIGTTRAKARAIRDIDATPPDLRRAEDSPAPLPKSSSWMGPLN